MPLQSPLCSTRALIATLGLLILQLAACNDDPRHKAAIDEMERRHAEQIERLGGSGGGGSGM
jgi:hypothetical protein